MSTKSLKTIPFCKAFLELLLLCYTALNGKAIEDNAKGRIRKSLFVGVLPRPFHAQSDLILF